MADTDAITMQVTDGVAWATIDHPPINLWDPDLTTALVGVVLDAAADDAIRVLVLASADPEFFVAHADVEMLAGFGPGEFGSPGTVAPINELLGLLHAMPKLTIAAVNGFARGGGSELALACDIRIAARSARLSQPEVAFGIIPGAGGTQRLTRLVGRARALEIILGCTDVTASEAAAIGYVNRVVDDADLHPTVRELAERVARMPPGAVAAAKRAVDAAVGDATRGFVVEAEEFRARLADDPVPLLQRFVELGGQTRAGEQDVDSIVRRLHGSS